MPTNLPLMPTTHLAYVTIGILTTAWVAHQLRVHGMVFIARGCKGNAPLAEALSHLLSVGFYLFHIGLVLLALKVGGRVADATSAIELLSTKIGFILIVLAASHFIHLALYARLHGKPAPAELPSSSTAAS